MRVPFGAKQVYGELKNVGSFVNPPFSPFLLCPRAVANRADPLFVRNETKTFAPNLPSHLFSLSKVFLFLFSPTGSSLSLVGSLSTNKKKGRTANERKARRTHKQQRYGGVPFTLLFFHFVFRHQNQLKAYQKSGGGNTKEYVFFCCAAQILHKKFNQQTFTDDRIKA